MPLTSKNYTVTDSDYRKRIPGIKFKPCPNDSLFSNGADAPLSSDVVQGGIGDCYLLSSLKAIALRNPNIIKNIIEDNNDGTVTVHFYQPVYDNGNDNDVTDFRQINYVLDKSQYQGREKSNHQALWVELIEKAYALHRLHINPTKYQDVIFNEVLSGGYARDVFSHSLGVSTTQDKIAVTNSPLRNGILMSAASYDDYLLLKEQQKKHPGLPGLDKRFARENIAQISLYRQPLTQFFESDNVAMDDFENHFPYDKYEKYHGIVSNFLDGDQQEAQLVELDALLADMRVETIERVKKGLKNLLQHEQNSYQQHLEHVYQQIHRALRQGDFVGASSNCEIDLKLDGIVDGHAYNIVNAYQRTDDEGNARFYIQLENPWGRFRPKNPFVTTEYNSLIDPAINYDQEIVVEQLLEDEGMFELEIGDFVANYAAVSYTNIAANLATVEQRFQEVSSLKQAHAQAIADCIPSIQGENPDFSDIDAFVDRHEATQAIYANHQRHIEFLKMQQKVASSQKTIVPASRTYHSQVINMLKRYLNLYLEFAKRHDGVAPGLNHKLFERKDRYVNAEREQRALLCLGLINSYDELSIFDQHKVLRILVDIRQQHQHDTSLVNQFHGDRLGKILGIIDRVSPSRTLSQGTFSADASCIIGAALARRGFTRLRDQLPRNQNGQYSNDTYFRDPYEQLVTNPILQGSELLNQLNANSSQKALGGLVSSAGLFGISSQKALQLYRQRVSSPSARREP